MRRGNPTSPRLQTPFDEGCRALAALPLSADDRLWIDAELQRIAEYFDLA